MTVLQATVDDISAIQQLLRANHRSRLSAEEQRDGFLMLEMSDGQIEQLIVKHHGVVVCKEGARVTAFAFAGPWEYWFEWPFFHTMAEHLDGCSFNGTLLDIQNTYQYGPVCVDRSMRGKGLFERVFYASLESMEDQAPIAVTFVNKLNGRSLTAHTKKVPMKEVGEFELDGATYVLLACPTDAANA